MTAIRYELTLQARRDEVRHRGEVMGAVADVGHLIGAQPAEFPLYGPCYTAGGLVEYSSTREQ